MADVLLSPEMLIMQNSDHRVQTAKEPDVNLILTSSALTIKGKQSDTQLLLSDIVGVKLDTTETEKCRSALHVYSYSKTSGCLGEATDRLRLHTKLYILAERSEDSLRLADIWHTAIKRLIYPLGEPRTVIVFVNPVSGSGNAVNVWKSVVSLVLKDGQANVTCVITERANHAKEYVSSLTDAVDTIISIGGDGLFFEVLQGAMSRPDNKLFLKNTSLVAVPGGTGNGLAKSVLFESKETFSSTHAAFVALKGTSRPVDLALVQTPSKIYHSFLSFGWGLISDIDILSESMRFLGESRLYVAAVYFIAAKRMYSGKLSFLEAIPANEKLKNSVIELPDLSQPFEVRNGQVTVLEGAFTGVWALQTSHATASMHSGPGVRLDDGIFTIIVIRKCSYCDLLHLLLSLDEGGHFQHPKVEIYRAYAYRLEPSHPENEKGIYSLDGEVIEYGPVQAAVIPSAMNVTSLADDSLRGNN